MKHALITTAILGTASLIVGCGSEIDLDAYGNSSDAVTEELFGAYNFILEIEGVTAGHFKNVGGLDSETQVVEYQDGDDLVLRKRPGRTKYSNITLKRGYTATDDLWSWLNNIEKGINDRRSGSIIILDQDLETEMARYNFYKGWPYRWNVPEIASDQSGMAIEKIEIAVEKIERAS